MLLEREQCVQAYDSVRICVYVCRMAPSQPDWNPGHSEEVMWQARPRL